MCQVPSSSRHSSILELAGSASDWPAPLHVVAGAAVLLACPQLVCNVHWVPLTHPQLPRVVLQVFAIKDEIEDKQLQYPEYYTRAFHGAHAALGCAGLVCSCKGAGCGPSSRPAFCNPAALLLMRRLQGGQPELAGGAGGGARHGRHGAAAICQERGGADGACCPGGQHVQCAVWKALSSARLVGPRLDA